VRKAIALGVAEVRHEVWRRTRVTKGTGPIYLDIDASLIEIHSENKERTGPNYSSKIIGLDFSDVSLDGSLHKSGASDFNGV
jgi:hypothetical protein